MLEYSGAFGAGTSFMASGTGRKGGGSGARLRDVLGNAMAARPAALIGWLVFALVLLAATAGAALVFAGGLDPDTDWGFRTLLLALALGGIFVLAALIAVLSAALREHRERWRGGRATVVATDHVVILNWSAALFEIVAELGRANRTRRRLRIVILAERNSEAMADEIARRLPGLRTARIICRTGDPADPDDLAIASPGSARAIIIVSPDAADADARVIKTVLALRPTDDRPARIVAEIRDGRNAELVRGVGGDGLQIIPAGDLMARLVALSSRHRGLGAVYAALLGGGSTLCRLEQKPIEGSSFGDAMMAYDGATLIGVTDPTGRVWLNPPMETVIRPEMKAVLIAVSAEAVGVTATPLNVDHTAIALYRRSEPVAERTLLLGWNRRAPLVAFQLSRHVAPGSLLTIGANTPELQAQMSALMIAGSNLQVEYGIVDSASRVALEGLEIASYDNVLVLAYADHLDAEAADRRTLMTLLHLRAIAAAAGRELNLVAELLDARNRELAAVTGAIELVVGSTLAGLLLARASENGALGAVLADLLDDQGSDIVLREAEGCLELGQPMTFYTVTEACRQRGEVALGYIRKRPGLEMATGPADGVVINPGKSEALTYEAGDKIIVLARP